MLTGKQKSHLRSMANTLEPIIQIGKSGITDTVVTTVDQALNARELVKVNVLNNCIESAEEAARSLAHKTKSELVQQLGKKIVLYRANPEKPVLNLPENK